MDSPDTYEQLQAENQRLRDQLAALTEPGGALALPWFDHVNDAIFVVDTSWRIRQWNRAAEEIYGWSRADVLGRHINDTIPVLRYLDYASETEAAEVLYREGTWRSRFQQIARDGRELVIDGSTRAILSERNEIRGFVGINRDITARVRAEQALGQSQQRFSSAFQNSPVAFSITEAATSMFLETNQSFRDLFGYSEAELIGQSVLGLGMFDDPGQRIAMQHQLAKQTIVREYPVNVRTKAGELRHVLASVEQIELDGIASLFTVLVDVTARRHVEQALHRTVERLALLRAIDQAALEAHAPATIAHTVISRVQDLLGCDHASIILSDSNRVVQQVFSVAGTIDATLPRGTRLPAGSPERQARLERGEPWLDNDIVPTQHDDPLADLLRRLRVRSLLHIPLMVQWQLIGTLNLVATRPGAFTDEHAAIAQEIGNTLALALHNAQLVASLQQELAARERVEQALIAEHTRVVQLKNEFMATMSHELRTPLAAVLGHTELLLEQIYGPLTARQLTALERITRSGQNLLALINDILDYTKFEAGTIALDSGTTNVAAICQNSVRLLVDEAQAKQLSISLLLDPAVRSITADGKRLQQMLVNLLSNAIKFSHAGGAVELEVRGEVAARQVTFLVRDQGIGIAEKDLAQLFQPFTQLDSRLSRAYEGTGLGLALVRRIAEAHGGSVGVESMPGQGSTFRIALPWQPGGSAQLAADESRRAELSAPALPRAPETAGAGATAQASQPTILLVEDNASNIAVLRDILAIAGYPLLVARDGPEGLTLARKHRPALILMDIQLPGMSGLQAIERMRADPELRHLPVIVLTALVLPGDRERCLAAGANEYLAKPVSPRELLAQVAQLVLHGGTDKVT